MLEWRYCQVKSIDSNIACIKSRRITINLRLDSNAIGIAQPKDRTVQVTINRSEWTISWRRIS